MGLFDNFPYSNFHELNLDWIINEVKNLLSLNGKVEKLAGDVSSLETYVKEYFANLDISSEVSEKIDQMAESGELRAIIETIILSERELPNGMTGFQNLARFHQYAVDSIFLQVQGSVYLPGGNLMYALIPPEEGRYGEMTARWVKKSVSTWETLATADLETGHTNSMALRADGKIICAFGPLYSETGERIGSNKMGVVDPDTLTLTETLEIVDTAGNPLNFHAVAVNSNGKIYIARNDSLYSVDGSVATKVADFEIPGKYWPVRQDITFYRDYILYLFYRPNMLAVYNIDGGLVSLQTIPYWTANCYYTGEAESCTVSDSGTIYIPTYTVSNKYKTSTTTSINCFDFVKGAYNDVFFGGGITEPTTLTVHVNSAYAGGFENGSEEYPYKSLQTAITAIEAGPYYKQLTINLKSGSYDLAYINNLSSALIIEGENKDSVTINGIFISLCQFVKISDVTITKNTVEGGPSSAVEAYRSTVEIENTNINGTNGDYCAYLSYGDYYLSYVTCTGANYAVALSRAILYGSVTYSEKPANRIYLENYSRWVTEPTNFMRRVMENQEYTFSDDSAKAVLMPSTIRLKDATDFQSGSVQLKNLSHCNHIEIVVKFRGAERKFLFPLDKTTSVISGTVSVITDKLYTGEFTLSLTGAGALTWSSNKAWNGTTVSNYSGSDADSNFPSVTSIWGLQI